MRKEEPKCQKICFLSNFLIIGGVEKVLYDALWFLHEKYDIEIILFDTENDKQFLETLPPDVKITIKPRPDSKFLKFCSKHPWIAGLYYNKALGTKCEYDYLIVLRLSLIHAVYSKISKHKIFWNHTDYNRLFLSKLSFKQKISKWLQKIVFEKFDSIWTVSDIIKDSDQKTFSLKNIHTLPNPINCEEIFKKSQESCDITFDKNATNIVMLGRLSREKGFERVIKMSGDIIEQNPNCHLYIIGGGKMEQFDKLVKEQGLQNKITLVGAKINPYPYLKQAQLLICPSYFESFGLVMLEAMLLKIRVISTATSGGKYMTQNGKYGICVENNDTALKKAIIDLLSDNENYPCSLEEAQHWAKTHDLGIFKNKLTGYLNEPQI